MDIIHNSYFQNYGLMSFLVTDLLLFLSNFVLDEESLLCLTLMAKACRKTYSKLAVSGFS